VSRDITMPLSRTVCHPSARTGTSHDQPVHQIWSLYVYSLQRYESPLKMQKLGWFGGLGITQGLWKHCHLIEYMTSYSTLIEIMHHFETFSSYSVFCRKWRIFTNTTCICRLHRWWSD